MMGFEDGIIDREFSVITTALDMVPETQEVKGLNPSQG
jgi:hypothetical protein